MHCNEIVEQIGEAITNCRSKLGPLLWTLFEKGKVASLKLSLEVTKNSLNLALEAANMFVKALAIN